MTLFTELKRRNVFRVGALYLVSSWLVLQAGDVLLDLLGVPEWGLKLVFGILVLGLPFVLFFSWAYEMTPDGLKREEDVDRSATITPQTGKRLDRLIIVVMALVIVVLGVDRIGLFESAEPPEASVPVALVEAEPAAESADPTGSSSPPTASAPESVSIAVLPFTNMSVDAANEFFADGIAEEILNLLAGVSDLEVASRTSSFAFKGKDASLPEIATALNVRYILEGSVRKAGEQVRITAQLIDAESDRHLWSDTFDRTLDDIFAVQDEIAGAIGEALQVRLLGEEGLRVTAETLDPQVYEQFLEARFLMRRRSEEALSRSVTLLEAAVEKEPDYARGLALLAEAYLLTQGESGEFQARVRDLAERALALDPNLAAAQMILGALAGRQGDTLAEFHALRQAVQMAPDEPRPHHWLAQLYSYAGFLDLALVEIDEAVRLEPGNANANGWRSTILAAKGDLAGAVEAAELQAQLGNAIGHAQAAMYHLLAGDADEAELAFGRAVDAGFWSPELVAPLVGVLRDQAGAREQLDEWTRSDPTHSNDLGYLLRMGLLALKLRDEYLEVMQVRSAGAISPLIWHPDHGLLREDPRFVPVLADNGVVRIWEELGPPPGCRREGERYRCDAGERTGDPQAESGGRP